MIIENLAAKIKELLSTEDITQLQHTLTTNAETFSNLLNPEETYDENDLMERISNYTHYFSLITKNFSWDAIFQIENDNTLPYFSKMLSVFPVSEMKSIFSKTIQLDAVWGKPIAYGLLYHLEEHVSSNTFNTIVYLNNELIEICKSYNPKFKPIIQPDGETNLNHIKRLFKEASLIGDVLETPTYTDFDLMQLSEQLKCFSKYKIQNFLVKVNENPEFGNALSQLLFFHLKDELDKKDLEFIVDHPQLKHLY